MAGCVAMVTAFVVLFGRNPVGEPRRSASKEGVMTGTEPIGDALAGATATPWPRARERLVEAESYWVATVRADRHAGADRPHVMPVLGLWLGDTLVFSTSPTSRKGRNLERNPNCVVTVSSGRRPAVDLVVEGRAARVTEETGLRRVAAAYADKYGWQVTVRDGALDGDGAPTAGPPPYVVYVVTPTVVFGLPGVAGTDDKGEGVEGAFGPTRWRFPAATSAVISGTGP
jgi:hypothetical protein